MALIATKYVPVPSSTPDAILHPEPKPEIIQNQPSTPVLPSHANPELQGVYELIQTIQSQQKLSAIVPYLTQESATLLSFNLIFGLQLMSSFKQVIPDEAKRQRFTLLESELNNLLQRYNIATLTRNAYRQPFKIY